MKFTREDIEEIKRKLDLIFPPKNDWQLKKCVLPIHGEEEVVIMQRGKNVRCNINDMYKHILAKEFGDFLNVDDYSNYPVMCLEEAISIIDPAYRKRGMVITFQTPDYHIDDNNPKNGHPVWEMYQFMGEVSQWDIKEKWVKINNGESNSLKITGLKIEGGRMYININSTWIDTNISFSDLVNVEKNDFDNIPDNQKKETILSANAVNKLIDDKVSGISGGSTQELISKINALTERVAALENNIEPAPPTEDVYNVIGTLAYSSNIAVSGGVLSPISLPSVTKNGSVVSGASIVYSSNQSYATVASDGKVTFQPNTNTADRTATITAVISYEGHSFSQTFTITQAKYVAPQEDVYALSGSFSYSGSVAASGGSKATATNTLGITKNGVAVSGVTKTYSSNQTYATVDSNGTVTFASHTNTTSRTARITATISDGTHTYTATADVTQAAYVETSYLYAGGEDTWDDVMEISDFNEVASQASTNKTFKFNIDGYNIVGVVYPTTMTIASAYSGELNEDIKNTLIDNTTTVSYKGKTMKMSQIKFDAGLLSNQSFTITFS